MWFTNVLPYCCIPTLSFSPCAQVEICHSVSVVLSVWFVSAYTPIECHKPSPDDGGDKAWPSTSPDPQQNRPETSLPAHNSAHGLCRPYHLQ